MKVSFVTTVLNEEGSIKDLLDSLITQTKKPDEVIIIDAGSTDKTVNLIKPYQKKLNLKISKHNDCNRSQGRNKGVKLAKHQVVAISDAGCTLKNDWLKKITKPLENSKSDSVAGFYLVKADNIFQKCISLFLATIPEKLNKDTYLPSSRSVAFKKTAFDKAGKYPENLEFCEDLVFAQNLKTKTKMFVEPKALVYWQMTNNLFTFFHQIKNYTYGDIKAKHKPHLNKIKRIYLRYLLFLILPIGFPVYILATTIFMFKYIKTPLALIYLPIIRITTDLAMILGSIKGKIDS